jgi:hypothetical protein
LKLEKLVEVIRISGYVQDLNSLANLFSIANENLHPKEELSTL